MLKYFKYTYHRLLLERYLEKYSYLLSKNIIDIGAAERRYDHLFDAKITSVDIVVNKEKNILYGNLNEGLNFSNNYFEGVLCIEVLEYVQDPLKNMQEISRLLKKGGYALVTVPFMYPDHKDRVRYTRKVWDDICNLYFSEVEIYKIGNGLTVMWDILRLKLHRFRFSFIGRLFIFCFYPWLYFFQVSGLDRKEDEFYSGLFLVLKK
ncbi:MAG: methyltransferase domain-containing protein [Candidatus Magasanikbacteria bacterium]|jgi:SAM-dependent methyltransferase|nr:methyltransferase domain-containing protein [Candidatus Magasanikbacteria bacterium]MBT4071560.1 methyltransferase domain-containing protein [Candidatus Magasanikbacteria bacterium]